MSRIMKHLGALALAAAAVAACHNDTLLRPPNSEPVDPLFDRYVSLGNSITAGFQSLGINDSTQLQAYPVLLAGQMHAPFFEPLMNRPGCPPPLTNVFSQTRVAGGSDSTCALRSPQPVPLPYISNVALPGADVVELINYFDPSIRPSVTDVYRTFLLGGRTEVQAAALARPSFVTVWIGNNDVLGAIIDTGDAGNAADITTPAAFAANYAALMDSLDAIGTIKGGALIGVVQVASAPYVSTARAYYAASQAIPTLTVDANCLGGAPIPGGGAADSAFVLVPFHYGAPLVARAAAGVATTLDCTDPHVISVSEAINMITSVALYNQTIAQAASARGWIFLDPNPLLKQLAADTSLVRPFPKFPPDPAAVTSPFGAALSRDGIHPSALSHKLVANALIQAINAKYGTTLQAIP